MVVWQTGWIRIWRSRVRVLFWLVRNFFLRVDLGLTRRSFLEILVVKLFSPPARGPSQWGGPWVARYFPFVSLFCRIRQKTAWRSTWKSGEYTLFDTMWPSTPFWKSWLRLCRLMGSSIMINLFEVFLIVLVLFLCMPQSWKTTETPTSNLVTRFKRFFF